MAALLIVDDDPIIRDTLCRLFADKYECDTVDRADQALELLEVTEYNAIITDVSMPGVGGVQILKRIQAHALPIPAIAISASGDQSKLSFWRCVRSRISGKPFRFEELESAVAQALDSRH